jgi:hypothetical protein
LSFTPAIEGLHAFDGFRWPPSMARLDHTLPRGGNQPGRRPHCIGI